MRSLATTLPRCGSLARLTFCGLLTAAAPALGQGLDHARLAQRFLERHSAADAAPATFDLQAVLREQYVSVRVGLFDLMTRADVPAEDLQDFRTLAVELLRAQARFLEWVEPAQEARALDEVYADEKRVERWLAKLSLRSLDDGDVGGDVAELCAADEDVRAAARRFSDYMISGAALGVTREGGRTIPLVLVPDRAQFTEFLCLGGWVYEHLRPVFWQPGVEDWTQFSLDEYTVLATRFARPGRPPGDYQSGIPMNTRTETGLEQQIVQLAANALLADAFGDRVPPSLAGALAVNLVVDLYGECNTRADGDLRARRTEAVELFVPGGNPDGGILPPNLADSRWREGHGADRFASVLKAAMESTRGPARFSLQDDAKRRQFAVAAPFLGASADATPPPASFFGDQVEFLRAYRTGFLAWLRDRSAKSSKASQVAFARLLQALAQNPDPALLEQVFADVYGAPLSGPQDDLGKDQLEGQYLAWLRKQR